MLKKMTLCILAVLFLPFAGCKERTVISQAETAGSMKEGAPSITNSTNSLTSSTNNITLPVVPNESEATQIFDNKIIIYDISRDAGQAFLKKPSLNLLKANSTRITEITKEYAVEKQWYVIDSSRFWLQPSLIEFLGDSTAVQNYLNQNGIIGTLQNMAVLDIPWVPITAWIKVGEQSVYITLCEDPFEEPYVYRLYTETEFLNRYLCKKGTLIVNDQIIETENAPLLYFNNADVPLMPVLEALGATVVWQNNEIASVQLNGVRYRVNIPEHKLCYEKGRQDNLLYLTAGGPVFVYTANRDIMADTASLACALSDMGVPIYCYVNNQSGTVEIQSRRR